MDTIYSKNGNVITPRPNWAAPVTESFEYRTEIFEAETGEERRSSQRTMPRISVQYRADMFDERARQAFEETVRPTDREFILPFRWRHVRLASPVNSGATQFTFDSPLPWWLSVGTKLVLESSDTQEVVTVASVTGSAPPFTIGASAPFSGDFAAGSLVMLGQTARYPQQMDYNSIVRSHRRIAPTFEVLPESLLEWETPPYSGETFKGLEVHRGRHNWIGGLGTTSDDRREVVDFGRGVRDVTWARTHVIYTEKRVYTAMGKVEADALVHVFMRHRGMRVPFWTRSTLKSLPQHSHGYSGTTSLWFDGTPLRATWDNNPVFKYLWVEWPDGSRQINRVTSRNESGGDERFIMSDPWDKGIDPTTEIHWAVLARFATDRLSLEWVTDEHCEASLPVRYLHCDWADDVV